MSPLDALADVVAPAILVQAVNTSERLTQLGVPHALIGGLAVGLHGHPRATRDVDFLVGDEAFSRMVPIIQYRPELADVVRLGVIDLMAVPPEHPDLRHALGVPREGELLPVIPLAPLVLLKLLAGRPQDLADVRALILAGVEVDETRAYLQEHAPDLIPMLAQLAA